MSQTPLIKELGLESAVKDLRVDEDPRLFYATTDFYHEKDDDFDLIANTGYVNKLKKFIGKDRLSEISKPGANALFISKNFEGKLSLQKILERLEEPQARRSLEVRNVSFLKKMDWSDDIDSNRHTRNNRKLLPINYLLNNNPTFSNPKSIDESLSQHLNESALDLYFELVSDGVSESEAFQVIPRTFELVKIEVMDLYSALNVLALRTCTQSREGVQKWARAVSSELGKHVFYDLDRETLPRAVQLGACYEFGNCRACGDVEYVNK